MIWLTIISVIATLAFVGVVYVKTKELPDSVSACVYAFEKQGAQLFWAVFMWSAGVCGMLPLMDRLGGFGWIGFLTMAGFGFLGIMPLTEPEMRRWHYVLGIATGVLSQICVAIAGPLWLLVWLVMVALIGWCFCSLNDSDEDQSVCDGRGVLIAEVLCAVSVWGCGLCC